MSQSDWFAFSTMFKITKDTSQWALFYNSKNLPKRKKFNSPSYGLQQKSKSKKILGLKGLEGVYVIAYKKSPFTSGTLANLKAS